MDLCRLHMDPIISAGSAAGAGVTRGLCRGGDWPCQDGMGRGKDFYFGGTAAYQRGIGPAEFP